MRNYVETDPRYKTRITKFTDEQLSRPLGSAKKGSEQLLFARVDVTLASSMDARLLLSLLRLSQLRKVLPRT